MSKSFLHTIFIGEIRQYQLQLGKRSSRDYPLGRLNSYVICVRFKSVSRGNEEVLRHQMDRKEIIFDFHEISNRSNTENIFHSIVWIRLDFQRCNCFQR